MARYSFSLSVGVIYTSLRRASDEEKQMWVDRCHEQLTNSGEQFAEQSPSSFLFLAPGQPRFVSECGLTPSDWTAFRRNHSMGWFKASSNSCQLLYSIGESLTRSLAASTSFIATYLSQTPCVDVGSNLSWNGFGRTIET